jgi:hypothetical protein
VCKEIFCLETKRCYLKYSARKEKLKEQIGEIEGDNLG